eukprot:scaffold23627_cov121-Isochrysis_galbana.AAC.10
MMCLRVYQLGDLGAYPEICPWCARRFISIQCGSSRTDVRLSACFSKAVALAARMLARVGGCWWPPQHVQPSTSTPALTVG